MVHLGAASCSFKVYGCFLCLIEICMGYMCYSENKQTIALVNYDIKCKVHHQESHDLKWEW